MSSLSTFGLVHTVFSLVAVGAGLAAFARHRAITAGTGAGLLYVFMTVVTCVTGFFIFAHGSFGKPHVLGIVTLAVIAVAAAARLTAWFGRQAKAVETVAYSLSFFFHMIPAITETSTRLPVHAPMIGNPDSPVLQAAAGVLFLVFLAGAVFQVREIRADARAWRR
jgi:hypothetical protein